MTYIIFRLLYNLFDLCCINLCKAAKHWDSFLSDCMCLEVWSLQGYVRDNDINEVMVLEELVGEERMDELSADWDVIDI